MTIETIQKMITDAPAASKWWKHHLPQLVFSKKIRALISYVLGGAAFACGMRFLMEDDLIRSAVCFVGVIVFTVTGIVCSEFVSKKYRNGLKMLHILYLHNLEIPATTEHQEPVFRLLLKAHSKNLQQCAKDLLPLRAIQLPAMWWVMVQEHVKEVLAQDQQQAMWDDLCHQIEHPDLSLKKVKKGDGKDRPFQSTHI